jgi:hypothetical protein
MVVQLDANLILNAHITCNVDARVDAIQTEFYFTEYAEEENIHGACIHGACVAFVIS